MRIGVLALQGAFIEHEQMLSALGVDAFEIRCIADIEKPFDGLILPGGESTVQGKLLRELRLFEPIKKLIQNGLPVFGTCAGLLLLAKELTDDDTCHLGTMNLKAVRNAYGRQLGSFKAVEQFKGIGEIPMIFIRAPYIKQVSGDTEILAKVDDKIVAARQNNQLVTSFHPELTNDYRVHQYFIDMVNKNLHLV